MTTSYRPRGFSTLTPLVVVSQAAAAIDFYTDVFGAHVTNRMEGPDGSVLHAELDLGDGRLQMMDAHEQFHTVASDPGTDTVCFRLAIYVPDTDAVTARATARGATLREEPADFEVTGARFASVQDPFGVRWTIMTRVSERTDAQIQAALDEWGASMS